MFPLSCSWARNSPETATQLPQDCRTEEISANRGRGYTLHVFIPLFPPMSCVKLFCYVFSVMSQTVFSPGYRIVTRCMYLSYMCIFVSVFAFIDFYLWLEDF
jgi:hypothetical protein